MKLTYRDLHKQLRQARRQHLIEWFTGDTPKPPKYSPHFDVVAPYRQLIVKVTEKTSPSQIQSMVQYIEQSVHRAIAVFEEQKRLLWISIYLDDNQNTNTQKTP